MRVDVKLIIISAEVGEFCKVDLLLLQFFSVEAWKLDVVKFPIKLDVLAGADLLGSGFHDIRSEKVNSYRTLGQFIALYVGASSLPTSSFSPFLSKKPHMLPCGISFTFGRSSNPGKLYSCLAIVKVLMFLLLQL